VRSLSGFVSSKRAADAAASLNPRKPWCPEVSHGGKRKSSQKLGFYFWWAGLRNELPGKRCGQS
jgi:hypothetical protein